MITHVGALRAWNGRPPVGIKVVHRGPGGGRRRRADELPADRPRARSPADAMVIADMGSVAPGRADADGRRCAAWRWSRSRSRTLAGAKHSGQFGGAAPDALLVLLRALASLHDEHGDVAVAGLRREEWTGESYSDEEFRELAEVAAGHAADRAPAGSARACGRGRRSPSRASTCRRSTARSTRSRRTRAAKLNLRVHPEQDAAEAQAALVAPPRGRAPVRRSRSRCGARRPATASRRDRPARPTTRRAPRGRRAWGRHVGDSRRRRVDPARQRARRRAARTPRCCWSAPPTATRTSTRPTSGCCSTSSRRRSRPRRRSSASTPRAGARG